MPHVISDEDGIRKTAAEYCRLYDDRRFDEFEDIWAEDATFRVRDQVQKGRHTIRKYIEGLESSRLVVMHCLFNLVINVRGDSAETVADSLGIGVRDGQIRLAGGGRALLRLVKHSDRWRIADMEFRPLLSPSENALLR